jgi:hypothetical protein
MMYLLTVDEYKVLMTLMEIMYLLTVDRYEVL